MQTRSTRRVITISILIVVVGLFAALLYRYYYQPTYDFVEVSDAQVTGNLTQIAAPASGQIQSMNVNVGDTVQVNQTLTTIQVISAAPSAAVAGPSISRLLTNVTSPVQGRVAALTASTGDTVAAGQPLVSIADLGDLWVMANVDESRIAQVKPGENVDANVAALNQTFHGKVVDIGSATTDIATPTASLLSSSDTTKKIPVRIEVDWQGTQPLPGMTVDAIMYVK